MNKVAQEYHESLAVLTERLRHGDRDLDTLVEDRRRHLRAHSDLTPDEIDRRWRRCAAIWRSLVVTMPKQKNRWRTRSLCA